MRERAEQLQKVRTALAVEVDTSKPAKKAKAGKSKAAKEAKRKEARKVWRRETAEKLREHGIVPAGRAWEAVKAEGFKDSEEFVTRLRGLNAIDGLKSAGVSKREAQRRARSEAAKKGYATRMARGTVARKGGKFAAAEPLDAIPVEIEEPRLVPELLALAEQVKAEDEAEMARMTREDLVADFEAVAVSLVEAKPEVEPPAFGKHGLPYDPALDPEPVLLEELDDLLAEAGYSCADHHECGPQRLDCEQGEYPAPVLEACTCATRSGFRTLEGTSLAVCAGCNRPTAMALKTLGHVYAEKMTAESLANATDASVLKPEEARIKKPKEAKKPKAKPVSHYYDADHEPKGDPDRFRALCGADMATTDDGEKCPDCASKVEALGLADEFAGGDGKFYASDARELFR